MQPTKKPAEKPEPEKKTGEAKKEVKKVQEAKREVQQAETPPPPPPAPAEPEPAPKEQPKEKAPAETAELGPEIEKVEEPKKLVTVRPRTKPTPPARPKAPKKEEDFNTKMAALLNKTNEKSSGTAKSAKPASLGSELGQPNVKMSQSELDALRGQVAQCWNPPMGAAGAEDLTVRLQFNLSRTGEVEGQARVLNSSNNLHSKLLQAVQSAQFTAAVRTLCQRLSMKRGKQLS